MFTVKNENVIEQIEANGRADVYIAVEGYWTNDTIAVTISRGWGTNSKFDFRIRYGSGGFCPDYEGADEERISNFANALLRATEIVTEYKSRYNELEKAMQVYNLKIREEAIVAERKRKEAYEAAEKERLRVEAEESPMMIKGNGAEDILKYVTANKGYTVHVRRAGETDVYVGAWRYGEMTTQIRAEGYKRISFYLNDRRVSKSALLAMLPKCIELYRELPWNYFAK